MQYIYAHAHKAKKLAALISWSRGPWDKDTDPRAGSFTMVIEELPMPWRPFL